jgi:peptide/nickel transport system substrate-binding protein
MPNARALPTNLLHLQGDRIGDPQDIDPAWAYDTSSAELLMNVYDPLLWFNRTNMDTYIPRLATSWTLQTIDETDPVTGLHWVSRVTFTIRTGVHFQIASPPMGIPGEGALLTPQDIEYSIERLLVTDAATGASWMVWEPLLMADVAGDLNATLSEDLVTNPMNSTTGWNTHMDEAIDHAVQSDATTVWFNLMMPYEPFLQIIAQQWCSVVNKAWCVWHNDWPGPSAGDNWYLYHDPVTSPLYSTSPASPGPNLDAALGTGPYMLDYWNRGAGGAWSIIKNPNYWEGWTVPFRHQGWGASELAIGGHVDRYTSNYIPEWSTRRLRFLGGLSDFCDVPRQYMAQVNGQPGVRCIFPLPQLAADACFFNFKVSTSSTHLGVIQLPSTFNQYGAPPNIMEDLDFRRALVHLFNYTTYLYAAFLNEAVSPVTPIIPGITYYDPAVGQKEDPTVPQFKKYGIDGEPAGQLAFDMALAKTYLQAAWGGQLWANGFTFDAVYNEGNLARQRAALLLKGAFDDINAAYGTKFTIRVASIPWNAYRTEQRSRVMPYFIVGWLADFPDAHNFANPFMHSAGAFSKWQGIKGTTSFPNQEVDDLIDSGIASLNPVTRQTIYTQIQHYYVNYSVGFMTSQPTGRHYERDWVVGWYYNPIYPGNYIYDLWKAIGVTLQDVDVEITNFACPTKLELGLPLVTNPGMYPLPNPISVTVHRKDANGAVPSVLVIISVSLTNASGREIVLDVDFATLGTGAVYTADFFSFIQDSSAGITPGVYTCIARVLVVSGFAQDTDLTNNENIQVPLVTASTMYGDVNVDGTIDMADISIAIDAFMTDSSAPNWDLRCDLIKDGTCDMADISELLALFMTNY